MAAAAPTTSARSRAVRVGIGLLLALGAALLLAEALLHAFPALLPRWYRELFPMHGIEFFRPGILEETPIEGLPLPILVEPHAGPPPADLKDMGVVPAGEDADRRRFPEVVIPIDAQGFPNPRVLDAADLLILGDSFAVAAGSRRPPGLAALLEEATGKSVYNLGVSAVGPVQEAWLLENVGLAKEPRCVLWLFFAGNDATASLEPLLHRERGRATYAQAYAERRAPRFILADLARKLAARPDEREAQPVPGIPFTLADGSVQELWFNPFTLRQLAWSRDDWQANRGWIAVQSILERGREACESRGAKLVLVYLPTAEEVYLPFVAQDPGRVHALASFGLAEPLAIEPRELHETLLERRASLESCVREFCAAQRITFFSAVPALESLARRGELAYLVADTHWHSEGQRALLEPLLEVLRREGVVE
jgi:hypothetical protein